MFKKSYFYRAAKMLLVWVTMISSVILMNGQALAENTCINKNSYQPITGYSVLESYEPAEFQRLYLEGEQMLLDGRIADAVKTFKTATTSFPDSQRAHASYGYALRQLYRTSHDMVHIELAAEHFLIAAKIAHKYGDVRYTDVIAETLGELKDDTRLNAFFIEVLCKYPDHYLATLNYANGLALLGDPRAEEFFRKAIELRPEGDPEAIADLGEFLLRMGRFNDALEVLVLRPSERLDYLHLLRGYALEKLGWLEDAKAEYSQYIPFSRNFPAPAKFCILGSTAQKGIVFEGDVGVQDICTDMMNRLSTMIYCESRTEGTGGMRAVGWTARTRVFNGTSSDNCLSFINNSGPSLCYKYYNVVTQSGQFSLYCGTRDSVTDQIASDVFYGYAPDPVNSWCPSGQTIANACTASCSTPAYNGAHRNGPIWFLSTSGTCPSTHPFAAGSCSYLRGKTCGNGGSDHCFYQRS